MPVDSWMVSCWIHDIEDLLALARGVLRDSREDGFRARSAIIIGGVPRRVHKAAGSIDGSSTMPFVVPDAVLEGERITDRHELTCYDDNAEPRRPQWRPDEVISHVAAFDSEARASAASSGIGSGDAPTTNVFAWGCIAAVVPERASGVTRIRALREVLNCGAGKCLEPLAKITCSLEPLGASGGKAELTICSGSSVWSGLRMARLWEGVTEDQALAAGKSNAEWLARTVRWYLGLSTGHGFEWYLDTDGVLESAGVIGDVLQSELGPPKQTHEIGF